MSEFFQPYHYGVAAPELALVAEIMSVLRAAGDEFRWSTFGVERSQVLRAFNRAHLHLAFFAPQLCDIDGLEVLQSLKHRRPALHCLLLARELDRPGFQRAVAAGVDGIVALPLHAGELLAAARSCYTGDWVLSQRYRHLLLPPAVPVRAAAHVPLSTQETALMERLCQDRLLKEAAAEMGVTYETARTYLKRVFGKYGVHRASEACERYRAERDPRY